MAFKLGYCALRWREPDLERALATLKEAGWDGWECRLPLDWLGTPSRVKRICDDAGMPICCFSAQGGAENPDHAHQGRNRRRMDFAAEVGADTFLYMSGRKPEDGKVTEDDIIKSAEAADAWQEYADPSGLELTYHIHTNLLVDSVDEWKLYMANLKKAKLCIDVSHADLWGYDAVQSLHDFRSQLNYVHLQDYSDCTIREPGKYNPSWVAVGKAECLDFKGCVQVLKDDGFDRWVTACPGAPPENDDAVSEAKRSATMYEYCRATGF
jgi:sugar phosphate isomerase/epimerase